MIIRYAQSVICMRFFINGSLKKALQQTLENSPTFPSTESDKATNGLSQAQLTNSQKKDKSSLRRSKRIVSVVEFSQSQNLYSLLFISLASI